MHMRSWVETYFFSELIVLHCITSWDFFFLIFLFYPWIPSLLNILFICSISVVYEGCIDNSESLPRISTLINCIIIISNKISSGATHVLCLCLSGWTMDNLPWKCWTNTDPGLPSMLVQKNRPLYFSAIFLLNCEENIFTYSIFFFVFSSGVLNETLHYFIIFCTLCIKSPFVREMKNMFYCSLPCPLDL